MNRPAENRMPQRLHLPRSAVVPTELECRRWYENVCQEVEDTRLPEQARRALVAYYLDAGLLNPRRRTFFHHHYSRTLAAATAALFGNRTSPPRILDLGGGLGTQSLLFALLGAEVITLDLDADSLRALDQRRALYEEAAQRPLSITTFAADVFSFDFQQHGPFDGVYSLFAFNMMQPSRGLLDRLAPALGNGAVLAIQDGNRRMWFNRLFRRRPVLSPSELRSELAERGFTTVRTSGGYAIPPLAWWLCPETPLRYLDQILSRASVLAVSCLHLATFGNRDATVVTT